MKTVIVILLLIGVSLGLVSWLGYSTIQETQRDYGQGQSSTKTDEDKYPPFKSSLRSGFIQIGSLVHDYREEIVAVGTLFIAAFTIVLAFATGFLYVATNNLVREAKHTSESSLTTTPMRKRD